MTHTIYIITIAAILIIGTLMFLRVGEVANTRAQDEAFMESMRMADKVPLAKQYDEKGRAR